MALHSLYDANGQSLKWEVNDSGSLSNGGVPAARVPITDTLGVLAATNADTAVDELAKYIPVALADPGTGEAIPVTRSASIAITTAAAETNTLAIPAFVGQVMALVCDVYAVGDRVITAASAINQTGNTIMTFGAAADSIVLQGMQVGGVLVERIVHNDGVALS